MNNTRERPMSRLAIATVLKRELIANASDTAVIDVSMSVRRKVKNLPTSG